MKVKLTELPMCEGSEGLSLGDELLTVKTPRGRHDSEVWVRGSGVRFRLLPHEYEVVENNDEEETDQHAVLL